MEVVLLPGMDGTGILFKPFTKFLNEHIKVTIIQYPCDNKLSYNELYAFVKEHLPKCNEFVLVAESFSSPIAYKLAVENIASLKSVIFVAGFLEAPRPTLLGVLTRLPVSVFLRLPLPDFMVRQFLLGTNASDTLVALYHDYGATYVQRSIICQAAGRNKGVSVG